MSEYKQHIFEELSETRKAQIILDALKQLELSLQTSPSSSLLEQVRSYCSWALDLKPSSNFQKTLNLNHLLIDTNIKKVNDLIVSFERFLNIATKDTDIFTVTTLDNKNVDSKPLPLFLVLDHIRSAFNVGSIFRTAECLGVRHISLVGYTPSPEDPKVYKTAMGTCDLVSWSTHKNLDEAIQDYKSKSIPIAALETSTDAQSLNSFKAPDKLALILGNERFGISPKDLEFCDHILSIPMNGQKNSLNVSNALSIAAYEITNQWSLK